MVIKLSSSTMTSSKFNFRDPGTQTVAGPNPHGYPNSFCISHGRWTVNRIPTWKLLNVENHYNFQLIDITELMPNHTRTLSNDAEQILKFAKNHDLLNLLPKWLVEWNVSLSQVILSCWRPHEGTPQHLSVNWTLGNCSLKEIFILECLNVPTKLQIRHVCFFWAWYEK